MRTKRHSIAIATFVGIVIACSGDSVGPGASLSLPMDSSSFAVYWTHACALDASGAAWCWGNNWRGELGDGTTTDREEPVRVAGNHHFVSISVSQWTSCGIDEGGTAWCWGDNQYGQLGAGWHAEAALANVPQRVIAPEPFVMVSAGGLQTCALTAAGVAYCWGSNHRGALGIGGPPPDVVNSATRVVEGHRFRSISSGRYSVCAVAVDHMGFCWGGGLQPDPASTRPGRVPGSVAWSHIDAGGGAYCGLSSVGDVQCWGSLAFIPGNSSTPSTILREAVTPEGIGATPGAEDMAGVCINYAASQPECMSWVLRDGRYYWEAAPVPGDIPFKRVVGSDMEQCGMTQDGELYCWARNQLPVRVAAEVDWATW